MARNRSPADTVQLIVRPPRRAKPTDAIEEDRANLKIRLREPIRQALERSAEKRGVSMNIEVSDKLESAFFTSDAMNFFFRGGTTLEEVLILRRYLEAIKEATVRAGDRAERWWVYASAAPFALDRERMARAWRDGNLDAGAFDVAAMAAPIRTETEKTLQWTIAALADCGVPGLPTAHNTPEEAEIAGRHLYGLWKSCEILGNRRRFESEAELREKYAQIYQAAAEWSQHKRELAPSDRQRYAAILDLDLSGTDD